MSRKNNRIRNHSRTKRTKTGIEITPPGDETIRSQSPISADTKSKKYTKHIKSTMATSRQEHSETSQNVNIDLQPSNLIRNETDRNQTMDAGSSAYPQQVDHRAAMYNPTSPLYHQILYSPTHQMMNYNEPQYLHQLRSSRDILYSPPPPPPPMYPQMSQLSQMHHPNNANNNNWNMANQQASQQVPDQTMRESGIERLPTPPNSTHELVNTNRVIPNPESSRIYELLQGIESRIETRLINIDAKFGDISSKLENQNKNWQSMEKVIQQQNKKITSIEHQVAGLEHLNSDVADFHIKLDHVEKKTKHNSEKIVECEVSAEAINYFYETAESERVETNTRIEKLEQKIDELQAKNQELKETQTQQQETILDVQCRSMRDNLIFFGIEEKDNEERNEHTESGEVQTNQPENTEEKLTEFIKDKMNITDNIQFHRVHRLGRRRREQLRPRPIVAKFVNSKDRERVRYAAPDTLKDTNYGVKEQFPKEIEERRKPLYQELKRAKSEGNQVKLVKDKLYINNQLYKADTHSRSPQNRRGRGNPDPYRAYSLQNTQRYDNPVRGRVFYQRNTRERGSAEKDRDTNQLITPNRFQPLSEVSVDQETQRSKRTAKSPIDEETRSKKHREEDGSIIGSESEIIPDNEETIQTEGSHLQDTA